MGENTKIEWADHTFNPWRGCTKVAPGCANCYAEAQSKRNTGTLGVWGPNGTRVVAAESTWKQVEWWNRDWLRQRESHSERVAELDMPAPPSAPYPPSIFCGSMCDVFEDWPGPVVDSHGNSVYLTRDGAFSPQYSDKDGHREIVVMPHVRDRLFRLIDATRLTWLLLTKRPENIRRFWPAREQSGTCVQDTELADGRFKVWLGTSIACQEDADRNIPELLKCRDLCRGVFLSIEPLIGPVMLHHWIDAEGQFRHSQGVDVDQVIIGGESGPHARPCNIEWIRSIARQCEAAGVKCMVKQLGSHCIVTNEYHPHPSHWSGMSADPRGRDDGMTRVLLRDKKGGDPAEWPEDMRQYRKLAWKGGA